MAHDKDDLNLRGAGEVLRDTDRDSYGVIQLTGADTGRGEPGEEIEYEPGDEALVDAGLAAWVVAPVHLPSAGRRLDAKPGGAEESAAPLGGVEVFPPAEPTTPARRSGARVEGYAEAHTDDGLGERMASRRAEVARGVGSPEADDVKAQAALGGLGARTGGGITAADLVGEDVAGTATVGPDQPPPARKATKAPGGKES